MNNVYRNSCRNEDGSVIVIVMIVLALLTVIGISATNMSVTEQKISGNDKNQKITFYHVESGPYGMSKWVSRILTTRELSEDGDGAGSGVAGKHRFIYQHDDLGAFLRDVFGFDHDWDWVSDLSFTMKTGLKGEDGVARTQTTEVKARLNKVKSRQAKGGGAEFGMGASGIGEKASVEIPFWFTAYTESGLASEAITTEYVKMLGVPGGL